MSIDDYAINSVGMVGAFKVVLSHVLPKHTWTGPVVLRVTCPVSDRCREEFNDWAMALFGGEKKEHIIVSEMMQTIIMHPATWERFKKHPEVIQHRREMQPWFTAGGLWGINLRDDRLIGSIYS